ncbi:MAG: hypothetical protein V1656_00985 [Candidatus Jorgensenbacteria bacterium]
MRTVRKIILHGRDAEIAPRQAQPDQLGKKESQSPVDVAFGSGQTLNGLHAVFADAFQDQIEISLVSEIS